MNYGDFFRRAFGKESDQEFAPFEYQRQLASGGFGSTADQSWPDLLDIPTGLGKTAAVVLAWLYKRTVVHDPKTPRRLIYCLPMRVLVEQTYQNTIGWLDRLGLLAGKAEWEDTGNKQRLKGYLPQPEGDKLLESGWAAEQGLTGSPIAVHLLMGGGERTDWITWPERDAILIGTQDMLLSRALNRGYAAGRARWPMDFGLLNNDCLWVFDEVQLMSTGLATSLQLDAWHRSLRLRGNDGFPKDTKDPVGRPCRSLWMSATTARHWLDSAVDWCSYADKAWKERHCLTHADRRHKRVAKLFSNKKAINGQNPVATLTQERNPDKADAKAKTNAYVAELAKVVEEKHSNQHLTLVILNTVERAVYLYLMLRKNLASVDLHLIHSRFRPMERDRWKPLFSNGEQQPRIIISTQVIEAGVDLSAEVLFTELAPWASLVQRFGRCARFPNQNGRIFWMNIDLGTDRQPNDAFARPYERDELVSARVQLNKFSDVGLESLREVKDALDGLEGSAAAKNLFPYDPRFVPRDKDLFDLFDTTPDLTGADVDISRYIRDGEELDVQVFWREVDKEPNKRDRPDRRELCPVAFYRLREQLSGLRKGGRILRWNYRSGWEPLSADQAELIYPGQVFLLEKSCGGYDPILGWTGDPKDDNFDALPLEERPIARRLSSKHEETLGSKLDESDAEDQADAMCELAGWVSLRDHSQHVCQEMSTMGKGLLTDCELNLSKLAARWHDRGKGHRAFLAKLNNPADVLANTSGQPVAKAPDGAWRKDKITAFDAEAETPYLRRPGFRHELASAFAILETLRQTHPSHVAFAWPEGLDKYQFDDPQRVPEPQPLNPEPAAQELATISKKEDFDLLLYLVAAHHGKVRISLRSSPDDARTDVPDPCPPEKRQARGVRDNDTLTACKLPDETGQDMEAPQVTLSLDPMELGLSVRYGPSWRERMQGLLERLGPFRLGYLEALLRIADWRASRGEDEKARNSGSSG